MYFKLTIKPDFIIANVNNLHITDRFHLYSILH